MYIGHLSADFILLTLRWWIFPVWLYRVRENKEIRVQCYFVFLVNFILAVTKGLRDQILSKYTHPFFLSPYPFSLSPQIISLDISQRSISLDPSPWFPNFFQNDGHFLFSWYFVPTGSWKPEKPCGCREDRRWGESCGMDMNYFPLTSNVDSK